MFQIDCNMRIIPKNVVIVPSLPSQPWKRHRYIACIWVWNSITALFDQISRMRSPSATKADVSFILRLATASHLFGYDRSVTTVTTVTTYAIPRRLSRLSLSWPFIGHAVSAANQQRHPLVDPPFSKSGSAPPDVGTEYGTHI